MKAMISDIHGNLEALQAVLEDADQQGAKEIFCLGDLVGYGPNPFECVDLAMRWKVVLLGNFDLALTNSFEGFGLTAYRSMNWTAAHARDDHRKFLAHLPRFHQEGDFMFVHGSPRNPTHEYIFPEDIYNYQKMRTNFEMVNRCCFQGHTHIPGIFTDDPEAKVFHFRSPDEIANIHELSKAKTLVNVGSVGQPRDGDPRACYVLLDGATVRFRRIAYDVETTVSKIFRIPELDRFLGERLRDGR